MAPGSRPGSGSQNHEVVINMERDTVPSSLLPMDASDPGEKKSSNGLSIRELVGFAIFFVASLVLYKLLKH